MPIVRPDPEDLVRRAWARVSAATGLTNDSESSVAMAIIRVAMQAVSDFYSDLEAIESQGNISTATGDSLDRLGAIFGVARKRAQKSTTFGGAPSVKFTNNGGLSQTIPAGTRVWPSGDSDRAFFTTEEIVVPSGEEGYVDVEAAASGAFYNVAAGTLTSHSLLANLSVTNILPISTGGDVESDQAYRARIVAFVARREGPNLESVRQAVLEVPSVRDVILINLARGAGTIDVLILPWEREVSQVTLDQVQAVLDDTVALGVSAEARAPENILIDCQIKLSIRQGGNSLSARNAARQAAHGYIDNLPIEDGSGDGTLIFSELSARIQQASPDILSSHVQLTRDDLPALKADQRVNVGQRIVSRVVTAI